MIEKLLSVFFFGLLCARKESHTADLDSTATAVLPYPTFASRVLVSRKRGIAQHVLGSDMEFPIWACSVRGAEQYLIVRGVWAIRVHACAAKTTHLWNRALPPSSLPLLARLPLIVLDSLYVIAPPPFFPNTLDNDAPLTLKLSTLPTGPWCPQDLRSRRGGGLLHHQGEVQRYEARRARRSRRSCGRRRRRRQRR